MFKVSVNLKNFLILLLLTGGLFLYSEIGLRVPTTPTQKRNPLNQSAPIMNKFLVNSSNVFYIEDSLEKVKLENVDSTSFEELGNSYGRDKEKVFYKNTLLEGADPETFIVLDAGLAQDKNAVYKDGVKQ